MRICLYIYVVQMVVGFLEDQASSIALLRDSSHASVLVAMEDSLNLFSEQLDVMDSVSVGKRIVRTVTAGSDNVFFACIDGSLAFQKISQNQFGSLEQLASPTAQKEVCVDADIHRTGIMAPLLFCSRTSASMCLVDTQHDAVVGRVPLGQTGTPNAVRVVDNSLIAVGSAIVSILDVRTDACKSGTANLVLSNPEAKGRIYTALESDGAGKMVSGDSSGGICLWDLRSENKLIKSVHAHSGAVLSMSLGGGVVGSSSADGSVALWTIVSEQGAPVKKKSRKLLLELSNEIGGLKRSGVEGSGAAICVAVDSGDSERRFAYATETGVLVLSSFNDFH
jgi:WD40 repeat protein